MPTISNSYPKPKAAAQRLANKSQGDATRTATATASPAVSAPSSPPSLAPAPPTVSNNVTITPLNRPEPNQPSSLSALGGEVIAPPERNKLPAPVGAIGSMSRGGNGLVGSGVLGGFDGGSEIIGGRPVGLSGLGGEVFNGPLASSGPKSAIGSGKDKWNSNSQYTGSGALNSVHSQPIGPPGGLWGGSSGGGISGSTIGAPGLGGIGGAVIGPNHGAFGSAPGNRNSGSSALASILGINLPSGSGSLGDSGNLWPQNSMQQHQQQQHHHQPAPVSSLHGAPMPSQGIIGRSNGSSSLIGGVPIGGNPIGMGGGMMNQPGPIGGSNKNDIALLRSLLPEVHITSGNAAPPNGWNSGGGQRQQPVGVGAVGAVGRGTPQRAQPQGAGGGNFNIW